MRQIWRFVLGFKFWFTCFLQTWKKGQYIDFKFCRFLGAFMGFLQLRKKAWCSSPGHFLWYFSLYWATEEIQISSAKNRNYCIIENGALSSAFFQTAVAMTWIRSELPWKGSVLEKCLRKIRKTILRCWSFFLNWESRILKIKEESTYKFLFLPVQGYLAKKLSDFLLELPARMVW